MTFSFFQALPRSLSWSFILLFFMGAILSWHLSYWWQLKPDYQFGFLVPFFSLFVIYDRWHAILSLVGKKTPESFDSTTVANSSVQAGTSEGYPPDAAVKRPSSTPVASTLVLLAWAGLLVGALGYLIGAIIIAGSGPSQPGSLAMATGFCGIMLSLLYLNASTDAGGRPLGWRNRLRFVLLFLFPAAIWLISAPLLSVIENRISLFLLGKVTDVVLLVSDVLGLNIERAGNVLMFPGGQVGVEEACSGIRSLTACLFAGSFLGAVFLKRFWEKCLLLGLSMFMAFLMNLFRSIFLTLWAYHNGAESIGGAVHDITGYAVLGVTSVLLLLICLAIARIHDYFQPAGYSA